MSEDRSTTTVRLRRGLRVGLERAHFVLQRSLGSIIEEALEEWLKEKNFLKRYQLSVRKDHIIVTEIDADHISVKDVQQRNGIPVEQLAEKYSKQFNAPVQVVMEEQ